MTEKDVVAQNPIEWLHKHTGLKANDLSVFLEPGGFAYKALKVMESLSAYQYSKIIRAICKASKLGFKAEEFPFLPLHEEPFSCSWQCLLLEHVPEKRQRLHKLWELGKGCDHHWMQTLWTHPENNYFFKNPQLIFGRSALKAGEPYLVKLLFPNPLNKPSDGSSDNTCEAVHAFLALGGDPDVTLDEISAEDCCRARWKNPARVLRLLERRDEIRRQTLEQLESAKVEESNCK